MKSATDCCQTEADSTRCMGLCAHCTCRYTLNNASMKTVRKWMKKNKGQLTTLRIWIPWSYVCGETHEAILKPSPEAKNSFWIKSRTGKIWDNFPQVQLTQLSGVLQLVWREYMKGGGRYSEHFSPQKVFTLTVFVFSWIVKTMFFLTSQLLCCQLPWLEAA